MKVIRNRRLWFPSFASGLGQALGLAQILILFLGTGATNLTDLYFLLYAWSQVPYQLVLSGVVYPIWLRGSGTSSWVARVSFIGSVPLAIGAPFLAGGLWLLLGRSLDGAYELVGAFAAQGALAAVYWVGAYWVSAHGNGSYVSAATVVPNGLACLLALLAVAIDDRWRILWLALGPALGFAAVSVILLRRHGNVWRAAWSWVPRSAEAGHSALGWFGAQSIAGYGSLLWIQAITASMPTSYLSVLGGIQRVQGGLIGVIVNAPLPRLIHNSSASGAGVEKFMFRMLLWSGAVTGLLAMPLATLVPKWAWVLPALAVLFVTAALNAGARRVATRFLAPTWAAPSIVVSVLVPLVLSVHSSGFSMQGLITALALLEFVPAAVLTVKLGWRRVLAASSLVAGMSSVLVFVLYR